jgi:hypothetical protein
LAPGAGFEVIRLMRRELAELTEMMSLGAGIPGGEQRIDMIKGLLARWHKKVPVIICIEAGAAGMVRATRLSLWRCRNRSSPQGEHSRKMHQPADGGFDARGSQ